MMTISKNTWLVFDVPILEVFIIIAQMLTEALLSTELSAILMVALWIDVRIMILTIYLPSAPLQGSLLLDMLLITLKLGKYRLKWSLILIWVNKDLLFKDFKVFLW